MIYDELQKLVERQAEDDGLWFVATTAAEAYLQQEIRKLHAAIESRASLTREEGMRLLGEYYTQRYHDQFSEAVENPDLEAAAEACLKAMGVRESQSEGEG